MGHLRQVHDITFIRNGLSQGDGKLECRIPELFDDSSDFIDTISGFIFGTSMPIVLFPGSEQ